MDARASREGPGAAKVNATRFVKNSHHVVFPTYFLRVFGRRVFKISLFTFEKFLKILKFKFATILIPIPLFDSL